VVALDATPIYVYFATILLDIFYNLLVRLGAINYAEICSLISACQKVYTVKTKSLECEKEKETVKSLEGVKKKKNVKSVEGDTKEKNIKSAEGEKKKKNVTSVEGEKKKKKKRKAAEKKKIE
jgi:hypothetical protein